MKVSWDDCSPYMEKKQTTNQVLLSIPGILHLCCTYQSTPLTIMKTIVKPYFPNIFIFPTFSQHVPNSFPALTIYPFNVGGPSFFESRTHFFQNEAHHHQVKSTQQWWRQAAVHRHRGLWGNPFWNDGALLKPTINDG